MPSQGPLVARASPSGARALRISRQGHARVATWAFPAQVRDHEPSRTLPEGISAVLFGRTGELHVLSSMAEAALRGRGKAVFLGGRHGIGKSALLDAVAQMHAPSFRLLRVTGHPDESGLPFAAVERLLAPVRDSVQGLPRPQRLALRVVLGLEEGSTDPFFVRMAVTGALQAAARKCPLMVLVDDVDSLDRESAGVISFFSRRIDGAPICLVCAGTDAGRRASGKIEGERLVLGPLSQVESLAFLEWLAPSSSPETRNRVVEESGGIPLLLRDASRVLTSVRLSGREPLPAGRRTPASPAGIVPGGVDTAEPPADLVVPQGPAPGACRVRTRPDAADGHEPRPAVVRHHILGTALSDRFLVPAAAGRRPPRAVLPFVAAEHAFAQGDPDRLAELVDETRTVGETGMRNRYARLRAIDTLVTRSPTAAVEQLLAAARMPDADDPAFAIDTLNMAAAAAWLAGDPCAVEEVHGARARLMATWNTPPPPEPTGGPVALRVLAGPWEAVGRAGADGAEDSTGAVSAARGRAASMPLPGFPMLPESGPVDAPGRLLAFYVGLLRRAVKDGEWGSVPVAAYWAACLETWLGRWEHATDHLRLGLSSAERTRQDVLTGHLRSLSAWLHAVRGDVAACRAEAEACRRARDGLRPPGGPGRPGVRRTEPGQTGGGARTAAVAPRRHGRGDSGRSRLVGRVRSDRGRLPRVRDAPGKGDAGRVETAQAPGARRRDRSAHVALRGVAGRERRHHGAQVPPGVGDRSSQRLRAGPHTAPVRRKAQESPADTVCPRGTARRCRSLPTRRCPPVVRPCPAGTRRLHGTFGGGGGGLGRTHGAGAAGGAVGRAGTDQPADRPGPVHQPTHRRIPPLQGISEARHPFAPPDRRSGAERRHSA
ncbi:Shy20 [Streptomyces hygroscopicus subsp. jinggangensis 5008]|nr:Shy20 [Streptomyces hygroscopicus subsp. jinggangensis 5008]AGF60523.1 Shy20 [Streptomyces hygroscopicus subsp. jinggangensis TL01]